MSTSEKRRLSAVAAAVAVLVAAAAITLSQTSTVSGLGSAAALNGVGTAPGAAGGSTASSGINVVFVHGAGCSAIQYTLYAQQAEAAALHLPASDVHSVGYYACDTSGESIRTEGSASYLPSPDNNGEDTDIRRISYELAWYLWTNFGAKDEPVDLVGHSMGGIVIAYALQRIAAHDPSYPKGLTVPAVVTFSAPFGGVSQATCGTTVTEECRELLVGSALLQQISAAGAVNLGTTTTWTLVGSDGRDAIASTSALALPRASYRVDYSYPAYTHTSYLLDASAARNAVGTLNGVAFRSGAHSLALLARQLA